MRLRWVALPVAAAVVAAGAWYLIGPSRQVEPRDTGAPGRTIVLHDGRRVGVVERGDPGGRPVFYFHGFLGSRLEMIANEQLLRRFGIRWIGIDRPGVGLSPIDDVGNYADWAIDAGELAEQLGAPKFSVLGWSAGAPLALAIAARLPDRVDLVAIAAPITVMDVEELRLEAPRGWMFQVRLAGWMPGLMGRRLQQLDARRQLNPRQFELDRAAEEVPSDAKALRQEEMVEIMMADRAEAFRQGTSGLVHDMLLMSRDWGFEYESIRVPVRIWHGEQDRIASIKNAEYLAGVIPGAEFVPVKNAGHYVALTQAEAIIKWLARR
ncbi:alpha/beta fold hydrolase [Paludibaculum fermentans]|uniref:Alpha/beta hydrolase n=1 Tax=Paludibaculum fermentans TaxID=1473598 RepID=A0A7S7NTV2_PALFE|nr:alpha/beta hydrolase [Paludibaculum fermentans]QOY89720.1 alpha/beta hydrolase [Paludibaculum fermentans]